jgi:4-amino-4-deoxy-L-arabinose transferase-like glycosyltransferase
MRTELQSAEAKAGQAELARVFWLLLTVVFLVALGLRLKFIAASEFDNVVRGDSVEYVSYAYNLVDKGVFSSARPDAVSSPPDSYRGPGYPAFLAVAIAMSGKSLAWIGWIRLAQALLGALTAVLTTVFARRMLPTGAAVACGLLTAFWPHLITSGAFLLTETLAGFLLLLALTVSDRAVRAPSNWRLVASGLLWGAAYLVNPVFLLVPLLFVPWLLRRGTRQFCTVFLLASLLLPAAWSVRNASIAGTGQSSGDRALSNFVQGSWPQYHAAYMSRDVAEEPARILHQIGAEDALIHADRRAGFSAVASRMAGDPWRYAFWYLAYKPFLLWDWSIRLGDGDIYVYQVGNSPFERPGLLAAVRVGARAINAWVFFAAIGYALLALPALLRRDAREAGVSRLLLVLLFGYLTAVHMILQAEPRYAVPYRPLEFVLAVLAVHGAIRWLGKLRGPSSDHLKVALE